MKTEIEDEELDEDPSTMHIPQQNVFARFAFDASQGKSTSIMHTARSSGLGRPSTLGKRKAEVDHEHQQTSLKTARRVVGKTLEKPRISGQSSSKVKLYAHLRPLHDNLETGLDIVFCGINPGQQSAEIGHHYGNPNNHFWSCLHESGLTSRRLDPREDASLPRDFSIGLINLVARPTAQQNELSKTEQIAGVSVLLEKVARYKPHVLCFVGLGIAEIVRSNAPFVVNSNTTAQASKSSRTSTPKAAVGLQAYKMVHSDSIRETGLHETLFFAVSSTSGRVVRYQKGDKVKQFQEVRDLVSRLKEGTFDTSRIAAIPAPAQSSLDDLNDIKQTELERI